MPITLFSHFIFIAKSINHQAVEQEAAKGPLGHRVKQETATRFSNSFECRQWRS